ncbi:MAG TPA: Ig-like domain repeat protein, partial [Thermoanaerobaculia bacterium]
MLRFIRASAALVLLCVHSPIVRAQAVVTTGFEDFAPGDVNGQQGWGHLPNSPTGGTIVPTPAGAPAGFGAQSLAVILRNAANLGVANNLFSATIDPPAGENGSTLGGIAVPDPRTTFRASFWYRTPSVPIISTHATALGRFAELDASSKGVAPGEAANRYAVVRLANTTNTPAGLVRVDMTWFVTSATGMTRTVATLNWGTWYRFEYVIQLVDGMDGANANDRFTLTISDVNGAQLGTACGSTWEAGYKTGGFGGGPTARAINGFDFWAVTQPNNIVVGHLDQFTMTAEDPAPLTVSPSAGAMNVCGGATTTLNANASGGVGAIAYTWRNAANAIVGSGPAVNVGAGTYSIAVTDALCATATNSITITSNCATPAVTWNAPAPIVYGTPLSATQLNATANVAGTFTYTPPAGTILGAGTHALSTDFAPADSASYNPVNGTTVQLTVEQRTTSIYVETVAPSPSRAGAPVTVSFVLNNTFGTPGGTITVTDGVDSCNAAATAHGCTLTLTTPGLRSLTATYSGDANHRGSTSAARLQRVEDDAATARVEGSTTICPGGSASVRVRFTGTAPWTIRWSDGVTETTGASLHTRRVTPAESTTYRLTSFRDAAGPGDDSGFARITVNVVPPPSIVRDGTTLRAGSGYESYQWFRDGAAAGSGPELRIDPQVGATYTVTGSREGCTSAQSAPFLVTPPAPPVAQGAVIPVVGNTPGANGSHFRTTLQLANATGEPMTGALTFTSELPAFAYALAPYETRYFDDVLPAAFNGLTSANVIPGRGPLPIVLAHVFN